MRQCMGRGAIFTIFATAVLACGGDGGPTAPPAAPRIDALSAGSVRAGDILVITGSNLTGAGTAALQPAGGAAVEVLIDGRVIAPESVTATEIRVRIPLDLAPGTHTLSVRVDGRTSNSVTFTVDVFTVSGTYNGATTVTSTTCNDADAQAELRQEFPPGSTTPAQNAQVVDQRPRVTVTFVSFEGDPEVVEFTMAADGTVTRSLTHDLGGATVLETWTGGFTAVGGQVRMDITQRLHLTIDDSPIVCDVVLDTAATRN